MRKVISSTTAYSQLVKLQKLSSLLLRARTSVEVAEIIIDRGFDALGAICGDVSIINPETKKVNVLAKKGYSTDVIKNFKKSLGKTPLLTVQVMETKKPYYIKNVDILDKKYSFAQSFIRSTNSKAAALLPLRTSNKILGVLQFTFRNIQEFNSDDRHFIHNLADQCAQALDKIIALEEARRAKDELETIFKGIDDGVIVRNIKGEITYVNPAAIRMHVCKNADELLGLSLEEYYALFSKTLDSKGNIIPIESVTFSEVMRDKKHVKKVFYKILKKNNKGYWWQFTSLPVTNSQGATELIVSVIHDITEEKQNDYSKDEFFGIASHELKTPVTSLKAYTQVLEKRFEQNGDAQNAAFLRKMDIQIDKLTSLIHDLLDITKIEAGRLQFYNELFEFNSLAQEIVEEIQWTTDKHKIVFYKSTDAVIQGDRERIGQVITNFLTNAIKYSPEERKIIAKVKKQKNEVVFSVQDFGIGIPPKDMQHVFERFYREKNLRGDTFPGLGLGLYIASEIIKRQSGRIWVESTKGKGSTFYFSLPLAKKQ